MSSNTSHWVAIRDKAPPRVPAITSNLKERINDLERDLRATPMRHYVYRDLPFAVFCYLPHEEWVMREEVSLLQTRLQNGLGRTVVTISLADLLWQAVDNSEGMAELEALEQSSGFNAAQHQVQDYPSDPDWQPLPRLLTERLANLDPDKHLVFIMRAGALAPNLYRLPKLIDEMKGQTQVPCVLFLPATTEGAGLRFMGIAESEGRGSFHTKIYTTWPSATAIVAPGETVP